jgi:hypothetical protein
MSHMEEVERRSAALYKAPRVSLDDIKAAIAEAYYVTGHEAVMNCRNATGRQRPPGYVDPLGILTLCILVMTNGFTIVGKSAPASPDNFDAAYGRSLAYEDAIKQVWPLMGFSLRDRLSLADKVAGPGSELARVEG